jgi:hypothetical protein
MTYNFQAMALSARKLTSLLVEKGVAAQIKTSRYQTQIKSVEVASATSIDELLPSLSIDGTLEDLTPIEEKAISGKYKAKLFKLSSSVGTLIRGESVFILNTFTEKGVLKTKDLAPEKLGLTTSRYRSLDSFDKAVNEGILALRVPSEIKAVLKELYHNVSSNRLENDTIPLAEKTKKAFDIIKPQDKQAIGKDFGEILSLRWYITQSFGKNFTSFFFSEISNEALVDFVVELDKDGKTLRKDVSAKFEAGAAPSIGAIADNIDKVYKRPNPEEKKACDVLKALAGLTGERETTSNKILAAFKTLDLPAYKTLAKTIGIKDAKRMTLKDIQDFIQTIANSSKTSKGRIDSFNEKFKDFYQDLGKNVDPASLGVVFSGTNFPKYFSLIMSPMGYALVDYMNKQPIYQEVLNNISREMTTEQVYLNFTTTAIVFKKKLFSNAEFKFSYGANAKNSDNTGIKFSMKL